MKIFITVILTLFFAFSVSAQKQAEVIVTSTFLRASPNTTSEKVQTVQKGDIVFFEKGQDANGWSFVSVADRQIKGWIRKDTIGAAVKAEKINASLEPKVAVPASTEGNTEAPPTVNPPKAVPTPSDPPEEVIRVETEEVNLNVRVVDDNNRSVKNLNQKQFEVFEDDAPQAISSLTTVEVPIINALVIDNSRSLRSQLEKIIEAGKILVGKNSPQDESAIVRFVSKDKIEVVQDFTKNKISLNNALNNLYVEGGQTAIIDAVYLAAKKVEQYQKSRKNDDQKLRALIVVSDGDDRASTNTEEQLFNLLRQTNVQIYAVGFSDNLGKELETSGTSRQEKAKNFLTRLSQETGGKVYFPDSIDELAQIAADISGELRTQYLISYIPTNDTRDGTFRKIRVVVPEGANKEKRIAITRTGRTSAPK